MKQSELQRAYIIRNQAYRNNSALLDLFTENEGRVVAIARGIKAKKKSAPALLQAFNCVWVSFVGEGELRTLVSLESAGNYMDCLAGEALFAGLYVNELIYRLLGRFEAVPDLFLQYQTTLNQLLQPPYVSALRYFEKKLLEVLGFALPLQQQADTHAPIIAAEYYRYVAGAGFYPAAQDAIAGSLGAGYLGADLIALEQNNLTTPQQLTAARRLLQRAIAEHLGAAPLQSRELFAAYRRNKT